MLQDLYCTLQSTKVTWSCESSFSEVVLAKILIWPLRNPYFLFWKSCFLCHPEKFLLFHKYCVYEVYKNLVNRPVNFHPLSKILKGTEPHFCEKPLQKGKSKSGNWETISCEVRKGSKVPENYGHISSTL